MLLFVDFCRNISINEKYIKLVQFGRVAYYGDRVKK